MRRHRSTAALIALLGGAAWCCGGAEPPAEAVAERLDAALGERVGVRVVDPPAPRPRSAEAAAATKSRGDAAFAAGGLLFRGATAGLVIGRVAPDTGEWFELSTTYFPGAAVDVIAGGGIAWVALGPTGAVAVDISDPRNPRPLSLIETPGSVSRLDLRDDLLVLAAGHAGVLLFDVSRPARPALLGAWSPEGYVRHAVLDRDRVVVAEGAAGVSLLAVERGGALVHLWRVATAGEARAVAVGAGEDGRRAIVVADGPAGLALLAADRDEAAVEAGRLPLRDMTRDAALDRERGLVFAAAGGAGVFAVDVGDFERPRQVGALETTFPANRLRIDGERLLVGNDAAGLLILDAADPGALAPITAPAEDR